MTGSDDPNAGVERNNLPSGTYSVTITDSNPDGSCQITEDFEIFEVLPLEISGVVNDALDCNNVNSGSINLSITGGTIATGTNYLIEWSNGAASQNLVDVGPGHYYVTVTDNNGCEINGDWEINRFEPIQLEVETETTVDCDTKDINQVFIASGSGGVPPYQYNWSSGTVSGVNNEFMTTNQNGLVLVSVVDSNGCSTNYSHNVDIPEIGGLGFTTNSFSYSTYGLYSINDTIQFTNEANGDYLNISWDFGDGNFSNEENPTHIYTVLGTYIVTQTVTYPFGCIYKQYISLTIEKGYRLIMPNAFTPNEDGVNDYFTPVYQGLFNMNLDIYDTWGSLIYSETGDNIRGWDGKIKGSEAENGNYYFNFTAETFYNEEIKESGAFVFIK